VSVHTVGVLGLVLAFVIGTLRPINLGTLGFVLTFLVGAFVAHETPREMYAGFPVDLFLLLVGVTYLFGVADANGTVARVVEGSARLVRGRRVLIPWMAFVVAALPAMAGALGSSGVALLAPLSMRLAERCDIDRRMVGLMVVHGAAAGNFSPLNVLGALVHQAVTSRGLEMSVMALFWANLACNVALAAIIFLVFGGRRLLKAGTQVPASMAQVNRDADAVPPASWALHHVCTLAGIAGVAVAALGFGLPIGFAALTAGAILQLFFPASSAGAEKRMAWSVVILVCGIVTYVAALQRYGTIDAAGQAIAALGSPAITALLICAVGAVTSAFASSAGILGAMIPLAAPLLLSGDVPVTGFVIALALSATVVDAAPFSTVGALVVANAAEHERTRVYRGLLAWGAVMVITAPIVTWLIFVAGRTGR
jgi:di/tricarboxylate transporter